MTKSVSGSIIFLSLFSLCPASNEFIIAGGGEFITPDMEKPSSVYIDKKNALVKRVSNWFIIQGHGSMSNDTIGTDDDFIAVSPSNDLIVTTNDEHNNLKKTSRYSGMDVLIIDACYVFYNARYKIWREVLPKGLILSYHDQVHFKAMDRALDSLAKTTENNPTITLAELGNNWRIINEYIVSFTSYSMVAYSPWSYGYILPDENNLGKNIYFSGKRCYKNQYSGIWEIEHNQPQSF